MAEASSKFSWVMEPKGDSVFEGSTVKLNCSAKYDPQRRLQYYWKFNDTDMNDTSSQVTIRNIPNGEQLVIKDVTLENQGKYQCFAKPTGCNMTFNGSAVATLTGEKYKRNHFTIIFLHKVWYVPLGSSRRKQGCLNLYKGVVQGPGLESHFLPVL